MSENVDLVRPILEVWHVRGGLVTRLHMHRDRNGALADLGLAE